MSKRIKITKKIVLITTLVLIALLGVIAILEKTNKINLFSDGQETKITDKTSQTTSDAPSAQSDFKAEEPKVPAPAQQKANTSVSDTGGTTQSQSSTSPLVSQDGAITVYSPTNNALFNSGASLSGKASGATVSYRLADDVSGVTASGSLKVVNGNFSGTFNFSTKATQGRLDVFQIGAGGVEKSIIEIPVRFR